MFISTALTDWKPIL